MAGLFGGDSAPTQSNPINMMLPKPKVVRMPTETDPSIVNAAQRARSMALKRTGRLSTILTDQLNRTVGSSGSALGA